VLSTARNHMGNRVNRAVKSQTLYRKASDEDIDGSGANAWANPGPDGARVSPIDGPSSHVFLLSMLLSRRLNRQFQSNVGLSMAQVRLLFHITLLGDGATLKQLIQSTLMDKAQMSRTMAGMVKSGYIGFAGPLKRPTRFTARTRAVLRPKGSEVLERALVIARRHHVEVLQELSVDERHILYKLFKRLGVLAQRWDAE
jgi:DNA-binding MarR family transcriptional regulator